MSFDEATNLEPLHPKARLDGTVKVEICLDVKTISRVFITVYDKRVTSTETEF